MSRVPQFTADAALGPAAGRYRAVAGPGGPTKGVTAQLRIGGGAAVGGGLGFHWPSWCEAECVVVAAACIAGSLGIDQPGLALACAKAEYTCLKQCHGSGLGWSGGFLT